MAKRLNKYITVPVALWDHPDLTLEEKRVLIDIDSLCPPDEGITAGHQMIASMSGIPVKNVPQIMKSLHQKSALEIIINEDNVKIYKPILNKARYITSNTTSLQQEDSAAKNEIIDYDFIQRQWNEICPMLPKIDRFTPRRKLKTRTCIKGAGVTIAELVKVFRLVATSSFLTGSTGAWKCTYDWLVKSPDNFQKVYEGQYHKCASEQQSYSVIINGQDQAKKSAVDDFYSD